MIIESLLAPVDGEGMGASHNVCCNQCGLVAETYTTRKETLDGKALAECPECGGDMFLTFSGTVFGFKMGARGFSSTKQGMKRARDLTAKNERLKKTQWDNVQPMGLAEGGKPRNPTKDGPYDPNGPFAKRDKNTKIIY